ncbi:uncharacterized protein LOC124819134 [Hydra vulgaris]|uniref:uncharacterized protein LOC124819134 n=1 Tax=Hydra vulgaris TaxID=6087 RepID=UPI001F5E8828|nr:uncharacterized protein LOC124819134 [Hydra vulgaris]
MTIFLSFRTNSIINSITFRTNSIINSITFDSQATLLELSSLDPFKSVGVDSVSSYVLRSCSTYMTTPLTLIFQKSFDNDEISSSWSKANVTPLFKKGSRIDPANYRPVSLTSIPCKIIEDLSKKRSGCI